MAITKKQITEALHCGVIAASENYRQWSDGLTLANSPEYLIVVEIASYIHAALGESECLRLEAPYRDVLAGADVVRGRGAPLKSIKDGKKADLALLKNGNKPTCVIEVKKNPTHDGLMRDLKRLRDVVYACRDKKGVLKHGFLSIYRSSDDTDVIVHDVEKFFKTNRKKAQAKHPSIETWDDHSSIVVEITAVRDR